MPLSVLLLLLSLGPALQRGGQVESVALDAPPGGRRQVFRLHAPPEDGGAELGWAAWAHRPRTRRAGERTTLELVFPEAQVRVLHVEERGRGAEQRLVWRELEPRGGRSVIVEVHGERAVVRDLAPGLALRRDVDWGAGARLPLALLADALAGEQPSNARRFEPLGAGLEPVGARVLRVPALGAAPGLRWVALERAGRPAGWWLFAGATPVAFQLTAGGPIATPGPADGFPVARTTDQE